MFRPRLRYVLLNRLPTALPLRTAGLYLDHRDHREHGECSCLSASALCASQSATGCFTGTICRCNARPPNSDGTIARAAIRAATRIATS